jgi:SUMO ligase MMS21 Smc5/6 complex component
MGGKMPTMKQMQEIGKEVQEYILEQRERMKKIEEAQESIAQRLDEVIGNAVETT